MQITTRAGINCAKFLVIASLAQSLQAVTQIGQSTVSQRRNIGQFFEKLRDGRDVTVAYLGGSISAGLGASDASKTSYRALVTSWIRSHNSRVKVNELNASVPGTGSAYAAIRVRRDVVEQKPDLVFVEFSSSDVGEKEEDVMRSVEGIIRQLLAVSEPPEIVLVHGAGKGTEEVIRWHELIASYYRLPSISLNIPRGRDMNDEGHALLAKAVTEFLAASEAPRPSPPVRILPGYYLSDEMTYGELKPFAEVAHDNSWRSETTSDRNLPSILLTSSKTGSEVTTVFEGSVVGLTFRMGPDGGIMDCLIDGKPAPAPLASIDTYSRENQIGTRIIAGGLPPGEHKLTVRVRGERGPGSSGAVIRLGAFLIGGARPERL